MVKIQCAEIIATPQMQKDVSKPLYSNTTNCARVKQCHFGGKMLLLRVLVKMSKWRKKSHQMLGVLSFCDREKAYSFLSFFTPQHLYMNWFHIFLFQKITMLTFPVKKKVRWTELSRVRTASFWRRLSKWNFVLVVVLVLQSKGLWYSLEAQQGRRLWAHVIQSQHL